MKSREPIQLIVNADDYGYFPCVSRGIVDAAKAETITATGILANHPRLNEQLNWLNTVPQLDSGVHLNLTFNQPLTAVMREKLVRWNGSFPNAYLMSLMLITGKLPLKIVREEWCAQIEACQSRKLVFLNSHEHIHMLPVLFPLALELAKAYNIEHIRLTQAEWIQPFTTGLVRNSLMQAMQLMNQRRLKTPTPIFLGLSHSGKLNHDVLAGLFATLKAGNSYELMCHPGYFAADEILDPKLIRYHDWQAELSLLQSPQLKELYQRFNIHLSHYHHLAH